MCHHLPTFFLFSLFSNNVYGSTTEMTGAPGDGGFVKVVDLGATGKELAVHARRGKKRNGHGYTGTGKW